MSSQNKTTMELTMEAQVAIKHPKLGTPTITTESVQKLKGLIFQYEHRNADGMATRIYIVCSDLSVPICRNLC